jgi:hypothetical protein
VSTAPNRRSPGPPTSTDAAARRRQVLAALAGPVTWEPCGAPLAADLGEEQCVRCGWLVDEHDAPTGGRAEPMPLRRAS